jgi:hypothetical protein
MQRQQLFRLTHPSRRTRRKDDSRRAGGDHVQPAVAPRKRAGSATNCSRHPEQQKKYV